ncbi:hypothetical protein [Brevifollis gellanilyticus]|uniref:Uncharacterized protein n=1 Tax=Brevifollis gellanilyticus TaxID=748831 RepID=A0A512MBU5_9BACT|nr:hypothetical protein [Brevifollis gellanilyticus]GEP44207.1 hypothetical protein BGE01nite_34980 [Brevifollis gellanilyticus]
MSDEASADATNRSPAGDYVRHPLLAFVRPSILTLAASFVALQLPNLVPEHLRVFLHVGIGVLIAGMYFWQFARYRPSFMEAAGILLISVGFVYVVSKAALISAMWILLLSLAWLVMTWIARRWPLLRGLTTIALFMFVVQVAFHSPNAAKLLDAHGWLLSTLDLVSLCLLTLIAFASSRTWHEEHLRLPGSVQVSARVWITVLLLAALAQLLVSAGGYSFWASAALALVLFIAWKSRLWFWQVPRLRWLPPALMVMSMNQIALGLFLFLGKSTLIWGPFVHALNSLAIFGLSFLAAASIWAATSGLGLQGPQLTAGKSLSAD